MKKSVLIAALIMLVSSWSMAQERKMELGVQIGTSTGVMGQYNLSRSLSLVGELGLQHRLAYTRPDKFLNLGMSPAIYLSGRWYFLKPEGVDNRGLFLSLGAFYEQGGCALLYNKKHKSLKDEINWASALVAKVGAEYPLFGNLNIKGSVGFNLGLEESKESIRRKMSNIHTTRNELVFDLGLSMYF